ncbi:hypothetical protein DH2020_019763 [Rehmannia glutinosa]|uniref:Uncharacterized protein n=1 Tax=Rehmannia glutinosa TaxID=99300 RepID=A0ABR0WIJ3_REHGL
MAVMAEVGFHLHHHHHFLSPAHTLFLLQTQNPLCHLHFRSISISNHRLLRLLSSSPFHLRRSRQWDPNAETYNTNNFDFDADDEEIDDFDDSVEQWFDVLEDYIDSMWIFKGPVDIRVEVFGSYGWALPFIISSMLLATGPKAFLMALALPLGQSTLTFALQRFQKGGKIKPNLKKKTKKKRPRAYTSRNGKFEETADWIGSKGARKKKKGDYQSWISKDDVSVSSSDKSASANFNGWDELDAGIASNVGFSRRAARKSNGLRGRFTEKGKNERLSENDAPLLLRLLISVFPFLSSWTKML